MVRLTTAECVKGFGMRGVAVTLTARRALVGKRCERCKAEFRVGERVIVKPSAPTRHERCAFGHPMVRSDNHGPQVGL